LRICKLHSRRTPIIQTYSDRSNLSAVVFPPTDFAILNRLVCTPANRGSRRACPELAEGPDNLTSLKPPEPSHTEHHPPQPPPAPFHKKPVKD
jgi:hypothetical protein